MRTLLQRILCDFSTDLDTKDIISRKIRAINLLVALASQQETQKQRRARACGEHIKEESPRPDLSPTPMEILCHKTQCIFCIGNERYSDEKRLRSFRRVSHMMDHVEDVHLRYLAPDDKVSCDHPVCKSEGVVLNNVNHFKNHIQIMHGITLREPRFVS